jgi:hypothetical protein
MKGETYQYEYIRLVERERALKALKKSRDLQAAKQKLVDEGKARWVRVPISNGYKLILELIE